MGISIREAMRLQSLPVRHPFAMMGCCFTGQLMEWKDHHHRQQRREYDMGRPVDRFRDLCACAVLDGCCCLVTALCSGLGCGGGGAAVVRRHTPGRVTPAAACRQGGSCPAAACKRGDAGVGV
eukprot:363337-Chlamydomonas_euryale.AAC.13